MCLETVCSYSKCLELATTRSISLSTCQTCFVIQVHAVADVDDVPSAGLAFLSLVQSYSRVEFVEACLMLDLSTASWIRSTSTALM